MTAEDIVVLVSDVMVETASRFKPGIPISAELDGKTPMVGSGFFRGPVKATMPRRQEIQNERKII